MSSPPLPPNPTLRVQLVYGLVPAEGGSRFYLEYSGTTPNGGTCTTLAGDIAAAWGTHLGPLCSSEVTLTAVDVLDITTSGGSSGVWTGSTAGSLSGGSMPNQVAVNIEYDIARRYRGGKPRMFLPGGTVTQAENDSQWLSAFVTDVNTAVAAFFTEVKALAESGTNITNHVNLSLYEGFTNITNSSGRIRAAPKYRTTALEDTVEGYAAKQLFGSQRRRRAATSP